MSLFNDLLSGASQAVDVYAKVQTVTHPRPTRPPVRRTPPRPAPRVVQAPQKSFVQQNQTQLLAVAGLLALLLVVNNEV